MKTKLKFESICDALTIKCSTNEAHSAIMIALHAHEAIDEIDLTPIQLIIDEECSIGYKISRQTPILGSKDVITAILVNTLTYDQSYCRDTCKFVAIFPRSNFVAMIQRTRDYDDDGSGSIRRVRWSLIGSMSVSAFFRYLSKTPNSYEYMSSSCRPPKVTDTGIGLLDSLAKPYSLEKYQGNQVAIHTYTVTNDVLRKIKQTEHLSLGQCKSILVEHGFGVHDSIFGFIAEHLAKLVMLRLSDS